jgi:hypothetical protein
LIPVLMDLLLFDMQLLLNVGLQALKLLLFPDAG